MCGCFDKVEGILEGWWAGEIGWASDIMKKNLNLFFIVIKSANLSRIGQQVWITLLALSLSSR